jgi:hypothetical protein
MGEIQEVSKEERIRKNLPRCAYSPEAAAISKILTKT